MKKVSKVIALSAALAIAGSTGAMFSMVQNTPVQAGSPTCLSGMKTYYDVPLNRKQQDIVRDVCSDYDIDMSLVLALIDRESDYKVDVVAGDDYGLMQINKVNHDELTKSLGIYDFLDLEQNVKAGVYILKKHIDNYGVVKGLMCYHLGETGAKHKWSLGITSDSYVTDIILTAINLNYKAREVIV